MSGEFERIARWFRPLQTPVAKPAPILGNGDDALAVRTDSIQVMSVDTLVEGTHFLSGTRPRDIATRALRSALSDLAAMGARPWFYTLSLVVPEHLPDNWWEELSVALGSENHRWQCPCLGGDTTRGGLIVLTVQVHGLCEWSAPVTRSGMQPGEDLWLLGAVGEAAVGLQRLKESGHAGPGDDPLIDAFFRPRLWFDELPSLAPCMSAGIDVSDGLVADVRHLTEASGYGVRLDIDRIPLSRALLAACPPEEALQLALSGGEDYALCFTAGADKRSFLESLDTMPLTRIGWITESPGLDLRRGELTYRQKEEGYDHFRT